MDIRESFKRLKSDLFPLSWKTRLSILALLIGMLLFFSQTTQSGNQLQASLSAAEKVELGSFPVRIPILKYGLVVNDFQILENEIQPNQFLADLLQQYKVDYPTVEQLVKNAKDVFDVRQLRADKPFAILTQDTSQQADYFIYEPNVYEYIIFHLKGGLEVTRKEREMVTKTKVTQGIITSSLWNAMVENGTSFELASKMEDALQWSIDFHHLLKGDRFRLLYEENLIDGQPVGVGQVQAAYFRQLDNEYFAIYFDNDKDPGYYDLEGRPMNKGFLKAPVKYTRISSRYNRNRFHPILKRRRPHLGTDYAAPYGTPIYSVGNGVVTKASYTKGNGNYVKIKHNNTYQTQYLHMQKFAKGIRPGVQVKQGQVIGYVGSTGLATGPHVCFRFWKNGRQVNHLRLKFPPPAPLPEKDLPAFFKVRDARLQELGNIEHPKKVKVVERTQILEKDIQPFMGK